MVECSEIIERPKRICRGRGRGRCLRHSEVSDLFSLERCRSDDVLVEILARLPLKSIFRFKCVSKRWHQLISKDYFRAKIIERNKMDLDPLYFFQTPRCDQDYPHVRTSDRLTWSLLVEAKSVMNSNCPSGSNKFGERVKVDSDVIKAGIVGDDFRYFICSSNGLLLCFVSHWIKSPLPWMCPEDYYSRCRLFYEHVTRYYIYNPLTKLGYLLPYSPNQSRRRFNSHAKTEPCPGIVRDCVALVVGSSTDNYDGYKVVRAQASLSNENIIEFETFSSHTREWRLSTVTVSVDTHKCFSMYSPHNLCFHVIEGAIYWMVGGVAFDYIFVYNDKEEEHNLGGVEMIKPHPDWKYIWHGVGMGESVDGLLQVAWVMLRQNSLRVSRVNGQPFKGFAYPM